MREEKVGGIQVKTLKEQVYEYLRDRIQEGELQPDEWIDMSAVSQRLGISVTPLRDALLRLETEGFVSVFPRRGIRVNRLTEADIRNAYQIIGSLEAAALIRYTANEKPPDLAPYRQAVRQMEEGIRKEDFTGYYRYNLRFHDCHIRGSGNPDLIRIIEIRRRRLYDFQRRRALYREWEEASIGEHKKIVRYLEKGDFRGAAEYLRDVHWSFPVQERYIRQYYGV